MTETPDTIEKIPEIHLQTYKYCYMDMTFNGNYSGRLIFKLFDSITPKTTENFRALCTGEKGYGYINTPFHRMLPGLLSQGGDIISKPGETYGRGQKSIFKNKFFDAENFTIKWDRPWLLGMANNGNVDTNGSQFFVTHKISSHMNDKFVCFGEMLEGQEMLTVLNNEGCRTGETRKPKNGGFFNARRHKSLPYPIVISGCGECFGLEDCKTRNLPNL